MSKEHYQDLIDRYIYDIVRRLPQEQRKDIGEELSDLIEDMLGQRKPEGDIELKDVEIVLHELGSPREMAEKYLDHQRVLIGPRYYDQYLTVLKTVLIAVAGALLVANVVLFFLEGAKNPFEQFGTWLSMCLSSAGGLFIAVTLMFALMERGVIRQDKAAQSSWSLKDLPPLSQAKRTIPKGDCVAGIVFGTLILLLFCFASQWLGAVVASEDSYRVIPLFDSEVLHRLLPWFILSLSLGIALDILQLVVGRYSKPLALAVVIGNVIILILSALLLNNESLWNPNFSAQMSSAFADWPAQLSPHWMGKALLAVIGFGTALECGTVLFRTFRPGKDK